MKLHILKAVKNFLVPSIGVLRAEGDLDFSGLITSALGGTTATQILSYMGTIVGGGIAIYLAWVFGRKAVNGILNAVRGRKPRV